jgi:uncharacterized protein (TIGR00269 family)
MKCSICKSSAAIYFRRNEGIALCADCLIWNLENKVRRTVSKYDMLKPADRIAVAISGGKDSLSLLKILSKLTAKFPRCELFAVMVDEGIRGYRDRILSDAKAFCEILGIPWAVVSFKELYGLALDEMLAARPGENPCSYCAVLRRKALNNAARVLKADKLALAHNLDDVVQTFLLNLMLGDPDRALRALSPVSPRAPGAVPRIKPLFRIPEKELALYAYLNGIPIPSSACPYGDRALRNDVRAALNLLELGHPGIKYSILRSAQSLASLAECPSGGGTGICRVCGGPSSGDICRACAIAEGNWRRDIAVGHPGAPRANPRSAQARSPPSAGAEP